MKPSKHPSVVDDPPRDIKSYRQALSVIWPLMLLLMICNLVTSPLNADPLPVRPSGMVRIMPVGDSITEGGTSFSNWRYPLWEKLYSAGYLIEYVGSRTSISRNGELRHEGYGGKNSTFLAATVPANFRKFPADIVLLHAGHNHFADQHPVPQIIADTQSLILSFRKVNPAVTILLGQPIPSAKLPKYAYLPELHQALTTLATSLDTPASRVIIVPHPQGFDPVADTVADQVHPNLSGATKMTEHWFAALTQVLPKPKISYQPEMVPYKTTNRGPLMLHLFKPDPVGNKPSPTVVFFYGGGWKRGTPLQFYPECQWFAKRGWLAVSADYRNFFTHQTNAFEADEDGRDAISFLRKHAAQFKIDPKRIVAAGASAGGQIAASCGTFRLDRENATGNVPDFRPNALLLYYAVIDNGPNGYGDPAVKARFQEVSPLHQIAKGVPPTLFLLGDRDPLIPVATAKDFIQRCQSVGSQSTLKIYPGAGHPIFSYLQGPSMLRDDTLTECWNFLSSCLP